MIAIAVTGRVQESETALIRWIKPGYGRGLRATLRRPGGMVAIAVLLVALAGGLFATLGQEFTPTLDETNIVMEVKRIPSTSLSQSQAMQLDNERLISKFPEVAFVFSRTGTPDLAADPMPPSASDTYIIVKPRKNWPDASLTKEDLISRIEAEASKLPGNKIGFSQPIEMRFNELVAGVREDLAVKVFGDEFGPMVRTANQIASVLRDVDGTSNVKVEQVSGLPFLEIRIDKGEIARRGLNLADVQDVVGTAIGGRTAGLLFENDRRFAIIVRLADNLRSDVEALGRLPVALPQGDSVPLRDLASFDFAEGPNQVSRENGKRMVAVTAEVRNRDIGSVAAEAQQKIGRQVVLPAGSYLKWGGQFETFEQARKRLVVVVPMGFALIFLLLLVALGSARDAILAFSAVPLALTGGVMALWLRGMPFSISAAVGFIALSGVAVLNGLVMLSFIKQLIRQGMPKQQAILEGALVRLRPVIMTALVASLGFLPMAMATGTGAEVQKPLATVVVGGLISATFLTLFVLPALYALFGREQRAAEPQAAAPAMGTLQRP
jgi:heavy metal efflux system protein